MPSDSFFDLTKRSWLDGLPSADPGDGQPWRDPDSGAVIAGDTVLVASKAYVDAEAAAVAADTIPISTLNQPGGVPELDSNGIILQSQLPNFGIVHDAGVYPDEASLIRDAGVYE